MRSNATRLYVSASIAAGLAITGVASRSLPLSLEAAQTAHARQHLPTKGAEEGRLDAEQVFEHETFRGNGRTCSTCHRPQDGFSTTPASARARFAVNPNDSLFRPSDSDGGSGQRYTRLLTHATVRVRIPLTCGNIWPEDDRTATSIVVNRGIPGLLDTPALDPVLMSDGRAPSLEQQALDAIRDHVEPGEDPAPDVLRQIAAFEVGDRFFSSDILHRFARRGPEPVLPPGSTGEEKRGRVHFLPTGACGRCHSGPMLNTTSSTAVIGSGRRFASNRAGELVPSQRINPFVRWHVVNNNGTERVFWDFADPGRILITAGAKISPISRSARCGM
jgi:cytochrome c peroxidase